MSTVDPVDSRSGRGATRISLVQRSRDRTVEISALAEGFTSFQASLLAGRLTATDRGLAAVVAPRLSDLDTPHLLPDIACAASHIADAVERERPIAIVTDHDADGATSHAIIRLCLVSWGVNASRLSGFISHRMKEGYGVSHALVERLLPELQPGTCVITADQGSSDEQRIALLRAAGHVIVVTDHHGVPDEGPPASAHAVVNPVRRDSQFPDKSIAGCHTALLVMAAVRDQLIARGCLAKTAMRASDFLDLCAVGTVADASTLGGSLNNRAIVRHGLKLMNGQPRACWRAFRRLLNKQDHFVSSDIAFQMAPRINARGRLGDAMLSVDFLTSSDEETAFSILQELDENNRQRRGIERENTQVAMVAAELAVAEGRVGLCLWLGDQGHAGVHGICASRIVERFGRPTICLSPVSSAPEYVTGSIRSTERVHVRNVLSAIQAKHPNLLVGAGGHAGAGGLRVRRVDVPDLVEAWDRFVREIYADGRPEPRLLVDGDIERPSNEHVEQIQALEPFGRGFEAPVFCGIWAVNAVRAIGDGTHLKLELSRGPDLYDAVWFGAKGAKDPLPVVVGQAIEAAYTVESNVYKGARRLQLQIRMVRTPHRDP